MEEERGRFNEEILESVGEVCGSRRIIEVKGRKLSEVWNEQIRKIVEKK